jgi:hypothetical protein
LQLIELHQIPAGQGGLQNIELARISREAAWSSRAQRLSCREQPGRRWMSLLTSSGPEKITGQLPVGSAAHVT